MVAATILAFHPLPLLTEVTLSTYAWVELGAVKGASYVACSGWRIFNLRGASEFVRFLTLMPTFI